MNELRFEWSSNKAKANIPSHGVSFEEARTVFKDEDIIRIIFSRKPTKKEQKAYFEKLI